MYTAIVPLAITTFNPIATGNITATIGAPQDTSPPLPAGDQWSITSSGGTGGLPRKITINVPKNYPGSVQLTYQLPDPNYVLVGLAFRGKTPPAPPATASTGRLEFRRISIERDTYGSQLTVTDSCQPAFNAVEYKYVILVQQVGTLNIGWIDPDIETETDE
jgi:hypothetical protein